MLLAGGMNFGVEIKTDGVLVVGFGGETPKDGRKSVAYQAGLRLNDMILSVNGKKVARSRDITDTVAKGNGAPIEIVCLRKGEEMHFTVTPVCENGAYKIGVWLRDSSAGIGTVTFIDPDTGAFGGLGHGISDPESGSILPVRSGEIKDVVITGIQKGQRGTPGELKGYLGREKTGLLAKNCPSGVYGILDRLPSGGRLMKIAGKSEVKAGDATILATLDGETVEEYTIKITELHRENSETKCFSVLVTDPRLIEKTGGIVQGMSGSPIIQNGCLVGAVTHVLIKEPTRGYGIYIENMLQSLPEVVK